MTPQLSQPPQQSTPQNNESDELKQILKNLSKHFRQAKDAMTYLNPASKLETNSLNFLNNVLGAIKSGISSLRDYYENSSKQPDISSREQENNIEEMTAVGAGGISGVAAPKSKKKQYRPEIEQIEESLLRVRNSIKEAIQEVYSGNKTLLKESLNLNILKEEMNSTGMNKLIEVFNEIRKILETKYLSLTTSKDQRISFSLHLLNSISDELNRLDMNSTVDNKNADFKSPSIAEAIGPTSNLKQPANILKNPEKKTDLPPADEDEAFKKQFTISGLNETGRNEALETYKNIFPKIEDAFANLSDREDRDIFKQYLIENLEALFEKLENQIEPDSEDQSYDEIYHDDGEDVEMPEYGADPNNQNINSDPDNMPK